MCYIVAVGVRPSNAELLKQNLAYGLVPAPPHVAAAFERGAAAFLVNVGHCACDRFTDPIGPEEIERKRVKYKEKGWSDSRIQRVLAERARIGGLDLDLVQQIVVAARKSGRVSLLVYWEDGVTTPTGAVVQTSAQDLVAQRWLLRAGTRVDIFP
jgi:hypothetical protein